MIFLHIMFLSRQNGDELETEDLPILEGVDTSLGGVIIPTRLELLSLDQLTLEMVGAFRVRESVDPSQSG